MGTDRKVKIGIDLLMFLALMLLMPYEMVGETTHEWIGMAMFCLFVLHHIMNLRWTKSITKGKYTPLRIFGYSVNSTETR